MKKKTKWQLGLILSVLVLTLYNILPTLLFYMKPLNRGIDAKASQQVVSSVMHRVNGLQHDAVAWIRSFNTLIHANAKDVQIVHSSPHLVRVEFHTSKDADLFKRFLPRAGSLIPFYPATLFLSNELSDDPLVVHVQRQIPIAFHPLDVDTFFQYAKMHEANGALTPDYWSLWEDRALTLGLAIGGSTETSSLVQLALQDPTASSHDFLYFLVQNLLSVDNVVGTYPQIAKRFYSSFTQGIKNPKEAVEQLIQRLETYKGSVQQEKITLKETSSRLSEEVTALESKESKILAAITLLKKNKALFANPEPAWTAKTLQPLLRKSFNPNTLTVQELNVTNNPVIEKIFLNIPDRTLSLSLRSDLVALRDRLTTSSPTTANTLNQLIYDEIAKIARESGETLLPEANAFTLKLSSLPHAESFVTLNLAAVAKAQYNRIQTLLETTWNPTSTDLNKESYPMQDWNDFQKLPPSQKHLRLVLYAPALTGDAPAQGFRTNSIYVIAKDLGAIAQKFEKASPSEEGMKVREDFTALSNLLKSQGFTGYPGTTYPLPAEYAKDYIFEVSDFYLPLLMATRENFTVTGSKKLAVLEFSDLRQRILTVNRIETEMHEDLLKWRDEYHQAQVDPTGRSRFDVPKPTRNILWDNFVLSSKKYFRGDERKILQWGLDLSGGKTVQIALKDASNKTVTSDSDLKQAINELFARVNKMGVSDVSIRQEGTSITLDFPGSQNVSASELVKASSMTFNIVNERFTTSSSDVNKFLQEVWNEALVTNKKDVDSINRIAWSHLYGDAFDTGVVMPKTETAKALFDRGLRLANPNNPDISGQFNDTDSKIALYRGDNFSEWHGQTHPLLIVFKNYALEGSNLEGVHSGYDPSKGNFLSFGVKKNYRGSLYSWTNVFAKDKLIGTPYEAHTKGHGWRMAVVLNGYVVSNPNLESALRDSGMITGHFTQREINKLVSDLQAGSLSFTPQILSEKTVSPELGLTERTQGITATAVALLAVIIVMISYYRFGGVIASIAVLLNLLILWATLQNIGATITLAGLAGIILTVGMAVDANVLVFERIREEFAKTQKLGLAIQSGYKRAFSAILDSNVTTIIAALVLLHFDSGPIKGFAITLIIGIVSSMFTALFMTRYFFTEWVKNPKHKELKMANLIQPQKWDFLKYGKAFLIAGVIVIALGMATLFKERATIFGMDFTGGFAVNIEFAGNADARNLAKQALLKQPHVSTQDFQLRELGSSNQLRIFLGQSLSLPGKPFHDMPLENSLENPTYSYKTNPRLVWLVDTLQKGGLHLTDASLETLDQNWRSISGQMSDTMRNNAVIGLALACLCILAYITVRFEFTYAISATIGLVFDIFMTLALLTFLHLCRVNIQIDLNTVAAMLTIAGYSLNDTIIVFDRVREELKHHREMTFRELINYSLNATLSRTLMTSGTTLLVLLCLVILGGKTLFSFSLVMVLGVMVGTLSTFFVASTLLLFFQKKESRKEDHHPITNGSH